MIKKQIVVNVGLSWYSLLVVVFNIISISLSISSPFQADITYDSVLIYLDHKHSHLLRINCCESNWMCQQEYYVAVERICILRPSNNSVWFLNRFKIPYAKSNLVTHFQFWSIIYWQLRHLSFDGILLISLKSHIHLIGEYCCLYHLLK